MKKEKIFGLIKIDYILLLKLERTMRFLLNSRKNIYFKNRVMDSAFNDACEMMRMRNKEVEKLLKDPNPKISKKAKRNPQNQEFIKIIQNPI